MKVLSFVIMIAFIMSGCEEKYKYDGCHEAKVISYKQLRTEYPKVEQGREIGKAAKIYNYKNGDILLINERNKGIHVVDNRIKHKVTKGDHFIEIPGNVDMAVKDGYLYADSFTDMLVLISVTSITSKLSHERRVSSLKILTKWQEKI